MIGNPDLNLMDEKSTRDCSLENLATIFRDSIKDLAEVMRDLKVFMCELCVEEECVDKEKECIKVD